MLIKLLSLVHFQGNEEGLGAGKFAIKDLGWLSYFLDTEVTQVELNQEK
jgi:hypothetical protein